MTKFSKKLKVNCKHYKELWKQDDLIFISQISMFALVVGRVGREARRGGQRLENNLSRPKKAQTHFWGSLPKKSPDSWAKMYSVGCSGQTKSSVDSMQSQSNPRGTDTV